VLKRFQPHAEVELLMRPIKSWMTVQGGLNSRVEAAWVSLDRLLPPGQSS
jgi:hypothetical protein